MKRLTKKDVMEKIEIIEQKLSVNELETIQIDTQEIKESLEQYLSEN